jgi:hypothetical protein
MRSIFMGSTLVWNIAAVTVGVLIALDAFSSFSNSHELIVGAWLSLSFAVATATQVFLAFVTLKDTFRRYIRFGLTSAAFSTTSPKLGIAWIASTAAGLAFYVGSLVEFISASKSVNPDEAASARLGVVWFAILGALMASILVGMLVVSRISPWFSNMFVRTPLLDEEEDERSR